MLEEYSLVELHPLPASRVKGIVFYLRIMDTDEEMGVRNGHEKESAELGNLGAVNEEEIQSATIV